MLDRLQYITVYVGSAAVAAFLAACLSAPRVATFACASLDVDAAQQCELVETLAVPAADDGDAAREDQTRRAGTPVPVRAPT
jgi:hypothetical protein